MNEIEDLTAELSSAIMPSIEDKPPDVVIPAVITLALQLTMHAMQVSQIEAIDLMTRTLKDGRDRLLT